MIMLSSNAIESFTTPNECKERELGSLTSMDKMRRARFDKKSSLLIPFEEFISSKFSVLDPNAENFVALSKGVEDLMREVEAFRQERHQRPTLILSVDDRKNNAQKFSATSKDSFNVSLSE
jgi:hypothetical protein